MRSRPTHLMMAPHDPPRFVFARGGRLRGRLTGGTRVCPLEGCPGARLGVRWPDGRLTWPCTKGMIQCADGDWEIP